MRQRGWMLGLVALALLWPGAARGEVTYKIEPILRVGDPAGDLVVPRNNYFWIGGFSERGHLIATWWNPNAFAGMSVVQVAGGKVTPIAVPGQPSPAGTWPKDLWAPMWAMSPRGVLLFTVAQEFKAPGLGLYRWDPDSEKLSLVLQKEVPPAEGLTIERTAAGLGVNDHDEIAIALRVRDADGKVGTGIFLLGRDGKWQSVLLPGQELPGGGRLREEEWRLLHMNAAGSVAFMARREGERDWSAFLWEQGTLKTLLAVGAEAPGGGTFTSVGEVQLNDVNREVLVTAGVDGKTDQGIYRVVDGQVIPVLVPGQELPGYGAYKTIQYTQRWDGGPLATNGIGLPNARGERAFLARLSDSPAPVLCLLSADGKVTPILRQGQTTNAGQVTILGQRGLLSGASPAPLINSSGQIVVLMEIDRGPRTIALLTPTTP